MLKNLTILALAGALLPACIITSGDTATDTLTSETTAGTTAGEGTTVGTTAEGTTAGSESATTAATDNGTTADVPTTGEPTTDGTTSTTGGTTTDATTGGTTGSPLYGMCGWVADANYYDCADGGGAPGVEDPAGIDPIACDPAVVEGADCTDKEGPVTNIGCCAENGDLFVCDSVGADPTLKIIKVACG